MTRAILGGFEGVDNSLPENINAGETHSWEFTTIIDEEWDIANIEVVGMLIDQTTGIIENATIGHLITGLVDIETSTDIKTYPNPTTGLINIKGANNANIAIYNISGSVLANYNNFSGSQLDLSDMDTGIYFIKVFSHDQIITSKLVIE